MVRIRGSNLLVPTHQLIQTTTSNAMRSNFGLKTTLPKQIGYSGIEFNEVDNARNMPDVEKSSGYKFARLRLQELEVVLKKGYNKPNPLFALSDSQTIHQLKSKLPDNLVGKFQIRRGEDVAVMKNLLKKNPELRKNFMQWRLENHPESFMFKVPAKIDEVIKEFLETTSLVTREFEATDLVMSGKGGSSTVQGTAGLSYLQKGRLMNTPNGVKSGFIAPGRLVKNHREAAIGGFVSGVNERTAQLQAAYIENAPGKHSRQFVLPFKVVEAEMNPAGAVRMYADAVKVGDWMRNGDMSASANYKPSNPNFSSMSERNQQDSNSLEALLGLVSRPRN